MNGSLYTDLVSFLPTIPYVQIGDIEISLQNNGKACRGRIAEILLEFDQITKRKFGGLWRVKVPATSIEEVCRLLSANPEIGKPCYYSRTLEALMYVEHPIDCAEDLSCIDVIAIVDKHLEDHIQDKIWTNVGEDYLQQRKFNQTLRKGIAV